MSNASTPIPWSFTMQEEYGKPQFTAVISGDNSKIADVKFVFLMHPSECNANAELIVRAVNSHDELVKAAERLLEHLDDSDDCDQDGNQRDVLHALREAIAKAKGMA